jgi:hypothetical protein
MEDAMGSGVRVLEDAVEPTGCDEELRDTNSQRMPDEQFNAHLIIEISDKDYRSFCWPCHALEETG